MIRWSCLVILLSVDIARAGILGPQDPLAPGPMAFDETFLSRTVEVLEPRANTVNGHFEDCYALGRACLYLSRCQDLDHRRDEAKRTVEEGVQSAQKAVLLDPRSARAHSLLALLYVTQIGLNDFFAAMSLGPKAGEENKKAQALDAKDAQTQLALATQYVMAPPIGGGNVKKGIQVLQIVTGLEPDWDEPYYWLAKAYRKENDRVNFKEALQKALSIDPDNRSARREWEDWP